MFADATDVSLAGTVVGKRVAVPRGIPCGSWQSAIQRVSVEAAEASRGEWRLILWQTTKGAYTSSSELVEGG
eukprot:6903492-Pyramimonas_sp.AAC.1